MTKMNGLFANTFENLNVLVTGHTGFKGSWLTIWLKEMGANVIGYSLNEPPTVPSNFEISRITRHIADVRGDICNYQSLRQAIEEYKPQLVIHLAAQTTVIPSYEQPKLSFDTNVGGTVNVLEAIRTTNSVKAAVICTTDKVYENQEWWWGYRENDRLGGYDPYSASKAMTEFAAASYRRSFFSGAEDPGNHVAIATVRAGNVIGGGDFTEYGLVADCMRALLAGNPIPIRNPQSIRPWQYVLEPLSGYLWLAVQLLKHGQAFAEAWNFGPLQYKGLSTQVVVENLIANWGTGSWLYTPTTTADSNVKPVHETGRLHLNWDKAAVRLDWRPVYTIEEALQETIHWFKSYQQNDDMYQVGRDLLGRYVRQAQNLNLIWSKS